MCKKDRSNIKPPATTRKMKILVLCATEMSIQKKKYVRLTAPLIAPYKNTPDEVVFHFTGEELSPAASDGRVRHIADANSQEFLVWVRDHGPYDYILDENCPVMAGESQNLSPKTLHDICVAADGVLLSVKVSNRIHGNFEDHFDDMGTPYLSFEIPRRRPVHMYTPKRRTYTDYAEPLQKKLKPSQDKSSV
jgi:hypothetical protein